MKSKKVLVVYPENKEQLTALKAFMKALKIAFESKAEVYPDYVVKGVKRAMQHADWSIKTLFWRSKCSKVDKPVILTLYNIR